MTADNEGSSYDHGVLFQMTCHITFLNSPRPIKSCAEGTMSHMRIHATKITHMSHVIHMMTCCLPEMSYDIVGFIFSLRIDALSAFENKLKKNPKNK